jgi:hypothetical protein
MKTAKSRYSHPEVLPLVHRINALPEPARSRVHEAFAWLEAAEKRALGLLASEETAVELEALGRE